MQRMTKTEFAQGLVSTIVTAKVAQIVEDQIFDRTNLDPDGLTAKASSFAIGAAVSGVTRPLTDKVVDKTVTKFQVWRASRKGTPPTE